MICSFFFIYREKLTAITILQFSAQPAYFVCGWVKSPIWHCYITFVTLNFSYCICHFIFAILNLSYGIFRQHAASIYSFCCVCQKMPQRRDNAGAVCDSGMGMLFLNRQFLSHRGPQHQKMG